MGNRPLRRWHRERKSQRNVTNILKQMARLRWYLHCYHPVRLVLIEGLAIMNPSAQRQITQYAASVTDLFKLMTEGKEREFAERVKTAGRFVFGERKDDSPRLLRDDLLDQFSLSGVPKAERVPNNQLALLSMVDCWWKLTLNPYDHMICSTPVHIFTLVRNADGRYFVCGWELLSTCIDSLDYWMNVSMWLFTITPSAEMTWSLLLLQELSPSHPS